MIPRALMIPSAFMISSARRRVASNVRRGGAAWLAIRTVMLAMLVWCVSPASTSAQATGNPPGSQRSGQQTGYVVPIEGEVNFRMVALVRRGVREALAAGASRLILDIDTPGGEVTKMEEILAVLEQLDDQPVDTVAWIRNQALSAGSVIALACKRIWVSPSATIGDTVPVVAGGLKDALRDEVYAKYLSGMRSMIAQIAAHHGPGVQKLAEAMVDPRLELVAMRIRGADGLIRSEILDVTNAATLRDQPGVEVLEQHTFTMAPLVLNADECMKYHVAEGRASSLDELSRELDIAPNPTRIEANWSEELAGFLYSIRMFLMIGGILMTVIAFKTPGTGVPEALAVLCFVFFFAGQFLVGLAAWTEILLFLGGIALILVEFFVMPGTLVAGVLGFLAVVAALFLSLQSFALPQNAYQDDVMTDNLQSLLLAIGIVIVLAMAFSRLLPKIPFFNRLLLEGAPAGGSLATTATSERVTSPLVGRVGTTLTELRPAGRVEIDGEPYDVVASGGFHEVGIRVRVLEVQGNRIVVEPVTSSEAGLVAIHWLVFMLFCGLLLLIAEVFFVSFGVLGTAAAVLTVSSVFLAFEHGTGIGSSFLAAVLVLAPTAVVFALRILPNTPFGKRLILDGPSAKSTAQDAGLHACIGKRGQAITPLRPVGTIVIDGRRYDAMTRGEGLVAGDAVEVLRIELGQLVVKRISDDAGAAQQLGTS
ncbi:MAG: hypothetical protein H6832_14385 [Planctomycetes bacterium]|nr:hypothetical protein [Planctomycetota bacterium]MCB9919587.1 hypothetical protein [Planctomycetota bacterium]